MAQSTIIILAALALIAFAYLVIYLIKLYRGKLTSKADNNEALISFAINKGTQNEMLAELKKSTDKLADKANGDPLDQREIAEINQLNDLKRQILKRMNNK
ncbi:MAG: hypothetical protein R3Y43_06500 [Alphaproteobacteria bacterium]